MAERIRHFVVWLVYHLLPRSPRYAGTDEQMASLTLYPTSRQNVDVMAAQSKPPATHGTSGRLTEEGTLDGNPV